MMGVVVTVEKNKVKGLGCEKLPYISEIERGNGIGFERIRRITGYLTGTLDRWGSAKQAEEHDRIKHS